MLVDAPCTGLGALRRRPESRWRRKPSDVGELGPLQRELLASAIKAVRPGGVVAYATCSPHPAETNAVVVDALRKREDLELLDAGAEGRRPRRVAVQEAEDRRPLDQAGDARAWPAREAETEKPGADQDRRPRGQTAGGVVVLSAAARPADLPPARFARPPS